MSSARRSASAQPSSATKKGRRSVSAKAKPTEETVPPAEESASAAPPTEKKARRAVNDVPVLTIVSPVASDEDNDLINANNNGDDDDAELVFPFEANDLSSGGKMSERTRRRALKLGSLQPIDDESDSSEEEPELNRIGDVPLEWYAEEGHLGYDVEGKKVMKPTQDALGELLDKVDDPNAMRTIVDPKTGEKIVLSNKDLAHLFNLQANRPPNPEYNAMYDDWPEQTQPEFDPLNHPLAQNGGPSRKKFVPALHEMKKVLKIVKRLRREEEKKKDQPDEKDEEKKDEPYLLWDDDQDKEMDTKTKFKYVNRIPKPKKPPPGTYESYRPPPEYLPSEETRDRWQRTRRVDRKEHFQPQMFGALRHVPFYSHSIQDQYQRCLDLCMFPRRVRTRLVVDPDKLLPELPDPKDLKPYPERLAFLYKGHNGTVRSISLSPNGQYLATGCDDHMVRVYEVHTGRLMKRYDLGAVVQQVEFCPDVTKNILAAAVEFSIVFLVPPFAAHQTITDHSIRFLKAPQVTGRKLVADGLIAGAENDDDANAVSAGLESAGGRGLKQTAIDADETAFVEHRDLDDEAEKEFRAQFLDATSHERAAGIVVKVATHARVKKFTWHGKGDYLCALCPKDHVKYRQTIMMQISRRKVFCPFRKFAEVVTDCRFHPSEPYFYLSTTNAVRCYNLMQHKMTKRYRCQGGVTTCLDLHPEGENFIVGDTTNHTMWYDTEYSDKPYKRMKSHKSVVNAVGFHKVPSAYPLFASGASDGQVHIFHGMVYDDYNKNALIVPVKILKHQKPVYSMVWHPTLPWIFTSTDDGTVCCWTE